MGRFVAASIPSALRKLGSVASREPDSSRRHAGFREVRYRIVEVRCVAARMANRQPGSRFRSDLDTALGLARTRSQRAPRNQDIPRLTHVIGWGAR